RRLSGGRRLRRDPAGQPSNRRRGGPRGRAPGAPVGTVGAGGRARDLPAFHAERDLRAAGGGGQYARDGAWRELAAGRPVRDRGGRAAQERDVGAYRRLRHELQRGLDRTLLAGGARGRSPPRTGRARVTVTQ